LYGEKRTRPMTVNTGVKDTLAKLLATEDIVIEHKQCETASFNVVDRVLVLPIWEKASNAVYDLLVAHEVGHALFTPQDWDNFECPQSFVNVTEDARIEKLMKRRYQGLPKTFYRGYQQFDEDDFFSVKGNIDKLNLIDRINLHFKIGSFTPIPIDDKYSYLIDMVAAAETFEEAVAAAREIWKVSQEEKKQQEKIDESPTGESGNVTPESNQSNVESSSDGEQSGGSAGEPVQGDTELDDESETGDGGAEQYDSDESFTDKALSDKLKELTEGAYQGNVYLDLPKVTKDQFTVSADRVLEICKNHFTSLDSIYTDEATADYNQFRKQSMPEVNFLLKEFECRKAASMYARASTSRTGVLDTQRLISYKFSDDIFKKVTVIPEGKNHGMIFILDWSGSMCDYLIDTVNQVIQLVWFCQKANIEFDVYAFTNDGLAHSYVPNNEIDKKKNVISVEWTTLLHLCSSTQTKKNQDACLRYLFMNAGAQGNRPGTHWRKYAFNAAPGFGLSGTPLNESIIFLNTLIRDMKKRAEKVTAMVLTDGEAQPSAYNAASIYDNNQLHRNAIYYRCFLRDRKLGKIYPRFDGSPTIQTRIFLENLKDNHPDVNILGFRLVAGRDVTSFFRHIFGYDNYSNELQEYRKNKGAILTNAGYDSFYVIPANTQIEESDLSSLEEGADRATATRAFKKMFKSKRSNKRILTSFIRTVA